MDQSRLNKFIGYKINVEQKSFSYTNSNGKERTFVEDRVVQGDDTIAAIVAEFSHYTLRVWLPGVAGTADMNGNRINVHVEKQADGSYVVTELTVG